MNPDLIKVILVQPEDPRNIGFVSRAMSCNGVYDLRLVDYQLGEVPSSAYITATTGKEIIDNIKYYPSVQEATKDCFTSIAFSRRHFDHAEKWVNLPDIHQAIPSIEKPVALVFGRESQGLNSEEIDQCVSVCSIPTQETLSYNLGQAVSIALYQMGTMPLKDFKEESKELPTMDEKFAFLEHLKNSLSGEYRDKIRKDFVFKNWLERFNPSRSELRMLFGVLRELTGKK